MNFGTDSFGHLGLKREVDFYPAMAKPDYEEDCSTQNNQVRTNLIQIKSEFCNKYLTLFRLL